MAVHYSYTTSERSELYVTTRERVKQFLPSKLITVEVSTNSMAYGTRRYNTVKFNLENNIYSSGL